jgi:hypothetical protein
LGEVSLQDNQGIDFFTEEEADRIAKGVKGG